MESEAHPGQGVSVPSIQKYSRRSPLPEIFSPHESSQFSFPFGVAYSRRFSHVNHQFGPGNPNPKGQNHHPVHFRCFVPSYGSCPSQIIDTQWSVSIFHILRRSCFIFGIGASHDFVSWIQNCISGCMGMPLFHLYDVHFLTHEDNWSPDRGFHTVSSSIINSWNN